MNQKRLEWCDEQIQISLDAFDRDSYEEKKLPKLSDSDAMDIIARASEYGSNPKNKNTVEDLAQRVSVVFLVTISRTGRKREEFSDG